VLWKKSILTGVAMWLSLAACGCQLSSNAQNVDGVRQFQQGQYQAALDRFQRVIAADPNNSDAHYNLAATLHDWGRRTENQDLLGQAEGMYHRCLDLSPDHVDCYRALSVLLVDTRRKDKAFTLLERWAERSPQLSDPKIELARLHEEFGDEAVAKQYLARALDVDPNSARAWAAMGNLREREGRLAQALTNYQNANRLNRNQPGVAQKIAGLQQRVASTRMTPGASQPRLTQGSTPWVSR
jgi:tetratricopeptide (TPR) repeat protein